MSQRGCKVVRNVSRNDTGRGRAATGMSRPTTSQTHAAAYRPRTGSTHDLVTNRRPAHSARSRHHRRRTGCSQNAYPRPPTATTSITAPHSSPTRQQIKWTDRRGGARGDHSDAPRRCRSALRAACEPYSMCTIGRAHLLRAPPSSVEFVATAPLACLTGSAAMTQKLRPTSARARQLQCVGRLGRRAEPRRRKRGVWS